MQANRFKGMSASAPRRLQAGMHEWEVENSYLALKLYMLHYGKCIM